MVLTSEGERTSAVNKSEGQRASAINNSEGERQAMINTAEGRLFSRHFLREFSSERLILQSQANCSGGRRQGQSYRACS